MSISLVSSLEELTQGLMSIPEEIKSIQIQILDLNEDSQQKSASINRLESVLKSEINSAVGDDNKKLYPNAEARDAAFVEKSSEHPELCSMKEDYSTIQRKIQELRIESEMLSNKQRNIRSLLEIISVVGDKK